MQSRDGNACVRVLSRTPGGGGFRKARMLAGLRVTEGHAPHGWTEPGASVTEAAAVGGPGGRAACESIAQWVGSWSDGATPTGTPTGCCYRAAGASRSGAQEELKRNQRGVFKLSQQEDPRGGFGTQEPPPGQEGPLPPRLKPEAGLLLLL